MIERLISQAQITGTFVAVSPCCGGGAMVYEIKDGQFQPIIGVCMGCGSPWIIRQTTFAHQDFLTEKEKRNAESIK